MARKQPDLSGLFRPTEPFPEAADLAPGQGQPPAEDVDRTLPVGVGIKQSELRELDRIARELGIARNALMRWALRDFLARYRAGAAIVEVETLETRRVKMP